MPAPFFTIVIPTRNRPELLRDALVSALFQDFDDYEVVVSDNYNDERTLKVLREFQGNSRLRCVRTECLLPMPEHWEFASRHAEGIYVLFLTDRSVLKRHALKTIYDAIMGERKDVSVCSWRWSGYDDLAKTEYSDIPINMGGIECIASKKLLSDFFESKPAALPRGLNSCYHKEVVAELRHQFGSVFKPINPDFSSAFLLLSMVDSVMYIDQSLFISQGLHCSNGLNATLKTAAAYLETLGERDWLSDVPIKAPLVENTIYQDFISIRNIARGALREVDIDWVIYFERCYRELIQKSIARVLSNQELEALYSEWNRALGVFDHKFQQKVKKRVRFMDLLRITGRIKERIKGRIKGSGLEPVARRLRHNIQAILNHGMIKSKQTVLEAAGFCGIQFRG